MRFRVEYTVYGPLGRPVLLYVTTHASTWHRECLRSCWPKLLAKRGLLRGAHVLIFSTGDPVHNAELLLPFAKNPSVTVTNIDNPGYQEGANAAMAIGIQNGSFVGYDWIIRLNPDVFILDDSWIIQTMCEPDVDAIFVDCHDNCPGVNCSIPNIPLFIHTDFFIVRPYVLRPQGFSEKVFLRFSNAELTATYEFEDIMKSGKHRWLAGAGPMHGSCRVRGDKSPVLHQHGVDLHAKKCFAA